MLKPCDFANIEKNKTIHFVLPNSEGFFNLKNLSLKRCVLFEKGCRTGPGYLASYIIYFGVLNTRRKMVKNS
jgi:hypothetical protein